MGPFLDFLLCFINQCVSCGSGVFGFVIAVVFCCCDKIPCKSNLGEKGFTGRKGSLGERLIGRKGFAAHSSRGKSITVVKSKQVESVICVCVCAHACVNTHTF